MTSVFFTSDLHIGHEASSRKRGFSSVKEHDDYVVETWNSLVQPRDIVWVLGDVFVGDDDYGLGVVAQLNGLKRLVSGNHDTVHPVNLPNRNDVNKWLTVFDSLQSADVVFFGGQQVMLSHFPYASWGDGEHADESTYDEYRLPDVGYPLVHGHTHGTERAHSGKNVDSKMFHVGWEAWQAPVHESVLESWVKNFALQLDTLSLSYSMNI